MTDLILVFLDETVHIVNYVARKVRDDELVLHYAHFLISNLERLVFIEFIILFYCIEEVFVTAV